MKYKNPIEGVRFFFWDSVKIFSVTVMRGEIQKKNQKKKEKEKKEIHVRSYFEEQKVFFENFFEKRKRKGKRKRKRKRKRKSIGKKKLCF